MLSCKEVATSISSGRLERSGWWHRLEVRLHLLMCRYCRRYAAQIRAVNAAASGLLENAVPDREAAAKLESSILGSLRRPDESSGKSD
jgi:anti-sigma factor ChrR (cupin superfamily)